MGGRGPRVVVPPPPSGQQDFLEVVRIWKDGERLWLQNWLGVWVGADFVDGVLLV